MLLTQIFTLTLLAPTSALPSAAVERAMPRPGRASVSISQPTTRMPTKSGTSCGRQGRTCSDDERQALMRREAEHYRADRAAYLAEQEAQAKREADRKRRACQADGGAWTAKIKGISMIATGSDVDEIYGKISVLSNAGDYVSGTTRKPAEDWGHREIWASKQSVNIGRDGVKGLATFTVRSRGPGHVTIAMNLYDEDDGRGGPNDDFFYLSNVENRHLNHHHFHFLASGCSTPEFQRIWRTTIVGRTRPPSNDQVFLHVYVEVSRFYSAGNH